MGKKLKKLKNSIPVDTIRIMGKDYSVHVISAPPETGPSACGHTDHLSQRISVVPIATQSTKDTILHECLHVMEYSVQLKLEEEQVHALAALILQTLWDNPVLAAWLITDDS